MQEDILSDITKERERQDAAKNKSYEFVELLPGALGNYPEDKCIEWKGSVDRDGYGVIVIDERQWRVHRLMQILSSGVDYPNLQVRHTCDNPSCYNPKHLLWGTAKDNYYDQYSQYKHYQEYRAGTHCLYGHELTEENTYTNPNNKHKSCMSCRALDNQMTYWLKKQDIPANVKHIYRAIYRERRRQDAKWGTQSHPDVFPHATVSLIAEADHWRELNGSRWKLFREVGWDGILAEEVAEAFDEALIGDVEALRKELIEVAAVCVAWIEDIDCRK